MYVVAHALPKQLEFNVVAVLLPRAKEMTGEGNAGIWFLNQGDRMLAVRQFSVLFLMSSMPIVCSPRRTRVLRAVPRRTRAFVDLTAHCPSGQVAVSTASASR